MKINKCRSCESKSLSKVFSLGKQKLTGIFPTKKKDFVPSGNLSLVFCNNCKLLQLEDSFDLNVMYGDNYGYLSSLNPHMVNHLKNKSLKLSKILNLKSNDIIIDIGSNDGTFLSNFQKKFILIGVDPTIAKLRKFYRKDIKLVADFFNYNKVQKFFKKRKAKLITSMSMFYDLIEPLKFAREIYNSLDKNGVWHLEQSYMPSMIKNTSYDTICHEHLEYYSLESIKYIFDKVGFKIIDLEFNDINGGSFALTLAKKKSNYKECSYLINWLLKKEDLFKYNSINKLNNFYENVVNHKKVFKNLILNLLDMKKKVIGYGASTKGNVILQYCNLTSREIPYILDVNKDKNNKYTPGTRIKIVSEKNLKKINPDYMVVLPWHFKNFIIDKEKKYIKKGGKLIFPLPDIEVI